MGIWSICSGLPAFSSASAYSFDMIVVKSIAMSAMNGACGTVSTKRTVKSSTLSIEARIFGKSMSSKYEYPPPETLWYGLPSFHCRSNVNSTSSALKSRVGVKSLLDCHFTLCRRWKV